MWVVHGSGVCIMVLDTKKRDRRGRLKWVYIREKTWFKMTEAQRARYIA